MDETFSTLCRIAERPSINAEELAKRLIDDFKFRYGLEGLDALCAGSQTCRSTMGQHR